jgi:tol-pal system protein YbgF
MNSKILPSLVLLPVLLATGGTRDRLEILERDVGSLKEDMVQVRQEQTKILLELEKLNQRLGLDRQAGMADVEVRMEGMDEDLRVLFENLNDMDSRLRRLSERVDLALATMYRPQAGEPGMAQSASGSGAGPTTPPMDEPYPNDDQPADDWTTAEAPTGRPEAPTGIPQPPAAGEQPAPGAPAAPAVDPEELYQTAYTDFARGNYELAILGFQDYVTRFPDTDLADNAQYWIGECHYSLERYPQSVQAFQEVSVRFPEADKVPDALLKKGYALIEMNQIQEGIRELQGLISRHPRSNAARIARQRLRSMGLSTP